MVICKQTHQPVHLAVDELFESGPREAAPPLVISVRALARVEADAPVSIFTSAAERRPDRSGLHGRLRVTRRRRVDAHLSLIHI